MAITSPSCKPQDYAVYANEALTGLAAYPPIYNRSELPSDNAR
jgi:hypothetical protein